jgi:hypothetical protein
VRHPDSDISRVGHRSECKTGGGDRKSRELGTRKAKGILYWKVQVAKAQGGELGSAATHKTHMVSLLLV